MGNRQTCGRESLTQLGVLHVRSRQRGHCDCGLQLQTVRYGPSCCTHFINFDRCLRPAEEERRVLGIGYDKLVVMLNSVQHLIDSFAALEKMVVER